MTIGLVGAVLAARLRPDLPDPVERRIRPATEETLFRGYASSGSVAPRPCACGGWIAPGHVSVVELAVRRHNETPRHQAWRARHIAALEEA